MFYDNIDSSRSIFDISGYINTVDDRLAYINKMENIRIENYGKNYMEYIETVYYDNDINDMINSEYKNISLDELINIVMRMDMMITVEYIKYIDGMIYDIGITELWNNMNLVEIIKMYQLLSVIKKVFGVNELNQITNVSKILSQSLFTKKYEPVCYVSYDIYNKRLDGIAILYDDNRVFIDMMKDDLLIDNENIKYLHNVLYVDNNKKIINMIDSDYIIIGVYLGELNNRQENYWIWKDYKILNEYYMGKIFNYKDDEITYNKLSGIKENYSNNKMVIRDNKQDSRRKRPLKKRIRCI